MVQIFPDDHASKCILFDDSSPTDGLAECFSRQSQPKRSTAVAYPTKRPSEDEHYVTISLSGDGPPQIKSSASLRSYKEHIVGGALARFLDCIGEAKYDSTSPVTTQQGLAPPRITSTQSDAPSISYPFARRAKRRRSNSSVTPTVSDPGDHVQEDDSDNVTHSSEKLKSLRIGDMEQCREYFLLGFQAIQQIDCRFLAKRWIKKIEPKKQVHHPYNGGKRDPKDPEATKPQWWPVGMTHKEPDHINKTDRITLLTHLIMHTGADLLLSVDTGSSPMVRDLEEVTKPHIQELKNPKSWSILQEMFSVRRYMELVEFEGNDPGMYHKMVVDRSSDIRRAQGEPKRIIDDDDDDDDEEEEEEEGEEGKDDPVEYSEPRCSDAEDGERPAMKAEPTPVSSTFSSPAAEAQLDKDHLMQGMDHRARPLHDMTPSASLVMKSDFPGQLPLAYGGTADHHSNLQSIPPYEPLSVYGQGQLLEQQLHQRANGSVSGLQQGADFSAHTLHASQSPSMSHWPATGSSDFCFPTQYQGMPSQASAMQPTASEQPVLDERNYQVHQRNPNLVVHYNIPIFDHPPQPSFSEAREMSTSRFDSHLAYRLASSNPISVSHLDDTSLPSTSEQLYQARLRELSDFE